MVYKAYEVVYNKGNNIHLTFIYMNEFANSLALEYIRSSDKLIFDFNKEIDFRLYVNKYRRNNQWIEECRSYRY